MPEQDRSTVKLQDRTASDSMPFLSTPEFYPASGWRCASRMISSCDVVKDQGVSRDQSLWAPYERRIEYCLVEPVQQSCKLQFSFPIAVTVVVANFVKAMCMLVMLVVYREHAALVTIGDAVASFLDEPDPGFKDAVYTLHA